MKCASEDDIELTINESVFCCICQEQTSSWMTVDGTFVGVPPVSIQDLLLLALESNEKLLDVLGEDHTKGRYICKFCELVLREFYEATQVVTSKREELFRRFRKKNTSPDPIEYVVIIETTKNPATSSEPSNQQVVSDAANETPLLREELFKVIDPNEEFINVNISDEDFVKVHQPDEEFEDDWSSDCSNEIEDIEKLKRKSLITIERMPVTKPRFCWRCDKNFPSDDAFETHLKHVHTRSKKQTFPCDKCHKICSSQAELKSHISKEHYEAGWQCELCGLEFDSASLLETHMARHEEYTCTVCSKTMSTHQSFLRHMAAHRIDKRYQCKECGNKYITKAFLQKHLLIHTDTRNFMCPVCDFKFRTAWNLKRHQKLHCLGDKKRKIDKM